MMKIFGFGKDSKPHPEGWHDFKIKKAVVKTARNGNKYLSLQFVNLDTKEKVSDILMLDSEVQESLSPIRERLSSFIGTIHVSADTDGVNINTKEWIGKKVRLEIEHSDYKSSDGTIKVSAGMSFHGFAPYSE